MTQDEFISNYWNYYIILEEKFMKSLNYIELSTNNYNAYGKEFVSQILLIGAELDTMFKCICSMNQEDYKTMKDYGKYIKDELPDILGIKVYINKEITHEEIQFEPLNINKSENIDSSSKTLLWWIAYNKIKHSRILDDNQASLKNTLYLLASLFILEMYYYKSISKDIDIPRNKSKVFNLGETWSNYSNLDDVYICHD